MLFKFFISVSIIITFIVLLLSGLFMITRDEFVEKVCEKILPFLKEKTCKQLIRSLEGKRMFCGIERIKIEGKFKMNKKKDLIIVSKDHKWYDIEDCWFEIESEKGKWEVACLDGTVRTFYEKIRAERFIFYFFPSRLATYLVDEVGWKESIPFFLRKKRRKQPIE